MITRTARETVMLEALERIADHTHDHSEACLDRSGPECVHDCRFGIVYSTIATVKAMDEAELAAGARNEIGEIVG